MPKKLLKRLSPKIAEVRLHPQLHYLGALLHKENLWHINRNSVANAFAVGLFCAFMPIPFQMLLGRHRHRGWCLCAYISIARVD